jgi:hypothetical protein
VNFFLKEPLSILNLCNACVVTVKFQVLLELATTTIRLLVVVFIEGGCVLLKEGVSCVARVVEEETLGWPSL